MTLTRAQLMLIDGAGEEEWTRWVKSRAHKWEWNGVHVRYSQGVIESIHTQWQDGFTEARGMPDWRFWHQERGQAFDVELKGATGRLSDDQKVEIPSLRRGGVIVFVWYPRHAVEAEQIFQYGLGGQDVGSAGDVSESGVGRELRHGSRGVHAGARRG